MLHLKSKTSLRFCIKIKRGKGKTRMKKKQISMLLAMTMVVSALVGCSGEKAAVVETTNAVTTGGTAETTAETKEEVKTTRPMTMVSIINSNVAAEDSEAFKVTLQDGKYEFDVTSLDRTIADEKISIMLSTNQYPDVFFKNTQSLTKAVISKYGKQGTFIALNDLIEEHAPNLAKELEERPAVKAELIEDDGNIYSLPTIPREQCANTPYWINTQWMENLGLEMPSNMDELYAVLEAFKEQDANGNGDPNDEIPIMQSISPQVMVYNFLPYVGQKFSKNGLIIVNDGVVQDVRANEAYKECLDYCARMFQNGLIDKNVFVQTVQQAQAVGQATDVTGMTGGSTPTTYCGNVFGLNFSALAPFYENSFYINPGVGTGAFVITDACEDPAKAMEWVDQFYSEEGSILAWLGIEGESYNWLDEEKTLYEWILPEGETVLGVRQKYSMVGVGSTPTITPEVYYTGSDDEFTRFIYNEKKTYMDYSEGYLPVLKYSDADMKTLATIEADILAYADTYAAKVITGELELEESWDDYMAQLDAMGLSKLQAIKQASYDANN